MVPASFKGEPLGWRSRSAGTLLERPPWREMAGAADRGGILALPSGIEDFDVTASVPPQTIPGVSSGAAAQSSVFEMSMGVSPNDFPSGSSLISSVTLSSTDVR